MRAKASKWLRWSTAGFVLTVAMLVGVEFADRLVPPSWRTRGVFTSASITYTNADGQGVMVPLSVEWVDEGRGNVAVASRLRVTFNEPYTNDSPFVPSLTRAQAENAVVASLSPRLAFERPELVPLLPKAIASPGEFMWVRYPERTIASHLMEIRSNIRFGEQTFCFWLLALPLWLMGLAFKWYATLWPRRTNSCKACGYDRTGIPATALCPECGKRS